MHLQLKLPGQYQAVRYSYEKQSKIIYFINLVNWVMVWFSIDRNEYLKSVHVCLLKFGRKANKKNQNVHKTHEHQSIYRSSYSLALSKKLSHFFSFLTIRSTISLIFLGSYPITSKPINQHLTIDWLVLFIDQNKRGHTLNLVLDIELLGFIRVDVRHNKLPTRLSNLLLNNSMCPFARRTPSAIKSMDTQCKTPSE